MDEFNDFTHPTQYRHYLRKYTDETRSYPEIDIELAFRCRYVSLENATNPSLKSVYTEDYAEHDGQRVWSDSNPIYNASELTLTLRWRQDECGDVQKFSDNFAKYITGNKFQYRDTFRPNKYWQFIFKESPEIKSERLYGNQQYRYVSYKLSNFGGKPSETSQL